KMSAISSVSGPKNLAIALLQHEDPPLPSLPAPNHDQFKYVTVTRLFQERHCPICMVDFQLNSVNTVVDHGNEAHHYHAKCIITHLKINPSCPICRTQITSVNGVPIAQCDESKEAIQVDQAQNDRARQALEIRNPPVSQPPPPDFIVPRGVEAFYDRQLNRVTVLINSHHILAEIKPPCIKILGKEIFPYILGAFAGTPCFSLAGIAVGAGRIFSLTLEQGALLGMVQGIVTSASFPIAVATVLELERRGKLQSRIA